ncbi:MAG: DUF4274 domain-containing protein [Clostridium sp.]
MDNSKIEYVHKLLYSENEEQIISEIKGISDSKLLHVIAGNYNWDNGFDIPYSIINNKSCDLGTALMIFYNADGYRVLENNDELKNPNLKQWANFISEIEKGILNNRFRGNSIKFIPPLTKVQIFKLKKNNPNIDKVFLEESDGEVIEMPII